MSEEEATKLVLKLLEQDEDTQYTIPESVVDFLPATQLHLKMLRVYTQRVLKTKTSINCLVANGRVIGPFESNEYFDMEDFGLLEKFFNLQYTEKIRAALKEATANGDDFELSGDTLFKLVSILVPRQQSKSRFTIPSEIEDNYTVVTLAPKSNHLPFFEIVAVLDPASRGAQKLSSLLILLRSVVNCNMRIILCAIDRHSDMPVKT